MAEENKIVEFKGRVIRQIYASEDYRVYALDVDKDIYPDIKQTKYQTVAISGEIHELGTGIEYEVKAREEMSRNGYGYKVINIKRNKPQSVEDMYVFLQEILMPSQAKVLYTEYPDIVERVMNDNVADVDLSRLHGIKEYTFNVIKSKIVENFGLAELVVEFQGLISLPMLKRLSDKYTSLKMIRKKFREDPYKCLCGLARVGFQTADAILLELEKTSKANVAKGKDAVAKGKDAIVEFGEDLKSSKMRCLACMIYLLEKNEEDGHTVMSISELRKQCLKMTPACCNYFVDCIKHESIVYNKDKLIVALKRTYETEQYIAKELIEGLFKVNNEWDFDCSKYASVDGFELTEEQINTMGKLNKHNVCILNGAGGTGKTSSTQAVINMLADNMKSFVLFSPTGKAAKVLSEYTKREATTIHRGLGYMPPSNWNYDKEYKLYCDVVVIDEFSMADIFLFKHVVDAIDFTKTKLLLIGDNAQLPSVACGNLLHDFMESGIIPTVTLSKVFRYGEGGLMKVATDVRLTKPYLIDIKEQFTHFGDNKDYAFVNMGDSSIVRSTVGLYQKLLAKSNTVENIQVLTAYKKGEYGTIKINNEIQKVANPNYGSPDCMKIGDTVYFKGDIIIQNVNNYHAMLEDPWNEDVDETFIANGETGKIVNIYTSYVTVDFEGMVVRYYRSDMQQVGLGYCITIHKSQGSSIENVILVTPQSHKYMFNSNLLYVGLTRMRKQCFHLGNVDTVNIAVKKKANLTRNTSMQWLIKEQCKLLGVA